MANAPAKLAPVVSIVDGKPVTTSTDIAQHFHKRHKNVLRAIELLDCSEEFRRLNFEPRNRAYTAGKGQRRESIYFDITRDGFVFLAMGFTGPEAARWKEAYINAFNAMERELLGKTEPLPAGFITPAQQNALQQALKIKAGEDGRKLAGLWSRFNNHFKLGGYKQLPSNKFEEAMLYIATLIMKEPALPPPPAQQALPIVAPEPLPTNPEELFAHAKRVMRGAVPADGRTRMELVLRLLDQAHGDVSRLLGKIEVMQDIAYTARFDSIVSVKEGPYRF